MKNCLRFVIVILVLMLCTPLLACEQNGLQQNDTSSNNIPQGGTPSDADELKLIVNGKPQYTILRPDKAAQNEIDAAVAINAALKAICGSTTKIETDWERNGVIDNEICVGNVTRSGSYYELSADSLATNEFRVKVCGTRLVLLGNTAYGTMMAAEWFIDNYLTSDDSLTELAIPAELDYTGSFEVPTSIRIMTQNLLATDTEYEAIIKDPTYSSRIKISLAEHTVAKRTSRVLRLITTYQPDSLGVQECSAPWREYFNSSLTSIGYGRIGADKNPKIGVIYNKSTLKPIANGSFWLTESPESLKISKEWSTGSDGLTERLGMYVVFEVISTGERYIHFNTHLDTDKNSQIQSKQISVILEYIEKISAKYDGIPVVLTGDFNLNSDSSAYKSLISTTLGDAKKLCEKSSGGGSFNKFIGKDYASLPIDLLMATKTGFIFDEYKVIYDTFDGNFVSDHYAVVADLAIKNN